MRIDLTREWQVSHTQPASFSNGSWRTVSLPCRRWIERADDLLEELEAGPFVCIRRCFSLDSAQARHGAVLRWELVRWGFEAFVNGTSIGATDLWGPGHMVAPSGLLREGVNEILLNVRTYESLDRAGSLDWPIIPVGSAVFGWGNRHGCIHGDISLELFDSWFLRSVMIRPDPQRGSVSAAIRIATTHESAAAARVTMSVYRPERPDIILGTTSRRITLRGAPDTPAVAHVKLRDFDWWRPEQPLKTVARVTIELDGEKHEREIAFGMRSFEIRDGHFLLNGKPHTLLGANLVADWTWTEEWFRNTNGTFGDYLDRLARMNAAVVRTHTLPPTHRLADLFDSRGILVLAEMPFTYNYQNPGFGAAEAAHYHERGKEQSLAFIEELSNHPSIVMWVSTNEPTLRPGDFDQTAWDTKVMIPAIKKLDPTRPVLRSGEDSADVQDIHCYDGFWGGAAGDYDEQVRWRAEQRDPDRPIGNSEYIENWNDQRMRRWTGSDTRSKLTDAYYAQAGARQTEILRRLGYDLVLPYGCYAWLNGDFGADKSTMMHAALRNSLAPVSVSVDCDNPNHTAGDTLRADAWLINDTNRTVRATLTCFVCDTDPCHTPGSAALARASRAVRTSVRLAPRSRKTLAVPFLLPRTAGHCWIVAKLEPERAGAVISQRALTLVAPLIAGSALITRTLRVVGGGTGALPAWFTEQKVSAAYGLPFGRWLPDTDTLVIWEDTRYTKRNLNLADAIDRYLADGRRVVMLAQRGWRPENWHWGKVEGFRVEPVSYDTVLHRASLAIPQRTTAAKRLWRGLARTAVSHLNGNANAVCRDALSNMPTETSEVLARSGDGAPLIVRSAYGKGQLLISQILLDTRLSRTSPDYDPVAERLFINMLNL